MREATASASSKSFGVGIAVPPSHFDNYESANECPSRESSCEGNMQNSRGKNGTSISGESENKSSRTSTAELVDFMSAQVRKRRAKEVQRLTGLSIKAIENMRMGLSGASSQTITTWCRNDPNFRAAYFAYCGGILEGDVEMLTGLTQTVQHFLRAQAKRGGE